MEVKEEKWWRIFESIDDVVNINDIIGCIKKISSDDVKNVNENLTKRNILTENENVYFSIIGGYNVNYGVFSPITALPVKQKDPYLRVFLEIRNEKPLSEENHDYKDEIVNIKRWDFTNMEVTLTLDEWKNYKRTSLVDKILDETAEKMLNGSR
jgi:hypothetical protein